MDTTEKKLFNEIFYVPSIRQEHLLSKQATVIKNPTYDNWLEFVATHNIKCAIINPFQLTPQKISAVHTFGQTETSALAQPFHGTDFFRVLSENINSDRYNDILFRVLEFINVAYDIYHDTRPWSLPSVTLYDVEAEVHPGNRLTTAHQILGRNVMALVAQRKNTSLHYDFDFGEVVHDNITTVTELRELFKGRMEAYIECSSVQLNAENVVDYSRLQIFSYPDDWNLKNHNGWPKYDKEKIIDINKFINATMEYDGEIVNINNGTGIRMPATIITNQSDINSLFSRTDLFQQI